MFAFGHNFVAASRPVDICPLVPKPSTDLLGTFFTANAAKNERLPRELKLELPSLVFVKAPLRGVAKETR